MCKSWGKREIEIFHRDILKLETFHGESCAKYIVRMARPYIGPKVIDLGAGSGALIALIPNAIGIDLVGRPERNVQKGDITNLEFGDGQFDTVFCLEVLEHLNDDDLERCVREAYRLLKEGGKLIITTPYREDLSLQIIRCPFCGEQYHRYGHQQSFDMDTMRNLLERHGFRHHLRSDVLPLQTLARHSSWRLLIKAVSIFTRRYKNSMNLFWVTEK